MRYLVLLLILIPAGEIGFLLLSGKIIGILPTVSLIILSGVVGAYLAKKQGLEAYRKVQEQIYYGEMPGDTLLDGLCILVGGIFLLSPGFITDAFGFMLLIPVSRKYFKKLLTSYLTKSINKGRITILR